MRFGIREICNVVFKATVKDQKVGSKIFAKGQPVIYFDSLKTSTMEQATTTVYAQGGRGNTRLVAWEGEKTLTFTMEDALISEMGLAILAGANLYNPNSKAGNEKDKNSLLVHVVETISGDAEVSKVPADVADRGIQHYSIELNSDGEIEGDPTVVEFTGNKPNGLDAAKVYLIDYYTVNTSDKSCQIDIEPGCFGGNFYIEADTLFRDTHGVDHAAQFIIPNGKVQSNFTFTMASSGDPSTFTFTVDAFPGYVNGDMSKKVMSAIQIIDDTDVSVSVDDPAGDLEDSKPSVK